MSELDLVGRTLGGYRVDALLGRGAFGWVYRAHQLSLDRTVALKVLDPVVARNPDAARRFDREGRSAASLDHPAIVEVFDADSSGGLHYLAMQLVDGVALDELLARRRLAPGDLGAMMARIAPALDHAHARGVVHRDVKPANILLEQGDPARAWLGDFGIAVSVRVAGALSTATVGTAHYMAPEQLEPARVGPASDQYSLACVAYEALTGRRPFGTGNGDDVMAVLLAHRADPVPPTGSPALDGVFRKALAKSPADRYPTVREFAAALDRAQRTSAVRPPRPPTAHPPTARPPNPPAAHPPRLPTDPGRRPFGARRRWLVAGGVAVLAAGAVAAFTLPGVDDPKANESEQDSGDPDWTEVRGPGDAGFRVPADWQRTDAGAVVIFRSSGEDVLVVGGGKDTGDADPATDLQALYECTDTVDTKQVAGLDAASCTTPDRHATIVTSEGTTVRFAFAATLPQPTRDEVLATLTIG